MVTIVKKTVDGQRLLNNLGINKSHQAIPGLGFNGAKIGDSGMGDTGGQLVKIGEGYGYPFTQGQVSIKLLKPGNCMKS